MVDHDEYTRWMAEARNALRSARVQAEAGLHNWACFAAEQAAQLALKAVLHGIGTAPWGHDLVDLGRRVGEHAGASWAGVGEQLLRLSRHYIPARYPDAHPAGPAGDHYGAADSDAAIRDAQHVLSTAEALWAQITDAAADDKQ